MTSDDGYNTEKQVKDAANTYMKFNDYFAKATSLSAAKSPRSLSDRK